ncbi:hypothetical protein ELG74_34270 (plasmid) [Rhizobium leguminosarum]|nr:hypothetical protein ELG85_33615 [Rhizobium leguminosarum]TBG54798.1 hypothetical protein ELG74_34270 [Rhizobium leguminosarum]
MKITPSRLSRPPSLPGLKRWSHQRSSALDASACQTGSAIESAPLTAPHDPRDNVMEHNALKLW